MRYRNFGRIVIFKMLHRPIQECKPVFHWFSSVLIVFSRGGKLRLNSCENVCGICVPRYFKAVVVHFSLKLACKCVSRGCGIPMPIASDLAKLIFKLESAPYVANSGSKFGRETEGVVSVNIRSSA